MMVALRLAGHTLFYSALTLLPVISGVLVSRRLGVRSTPWSLLIGLCALGVAGYVDFWAYFLSPGAGRVVANALWVVLALAGLAAAATLLKGRSVREALPAQLVVPALLLVLVTLGAEGVGFGHAGVNQPLGDNARQRFLSVPDLPIDYDNQIPLILANAVRSPKRPLPNPLYNDWLASDRPPLQSGVYLLEASLTGTSDTTGLDYQVVASLLQSLWILGMWALLGAARVPRLLSALILAASIFSGFVLLNTLYAWPKLVTAAYLLPIAAIILFEVRPSGPRHLWAGALAGGAAGLAVLFHGSAVFGLIAIALTAIALRRLPPRAFIGGALAALLLLQGSWMAYQHFGDPPGDRLIKWQIAGVPALDHRSALTVIEGAYSTAGVGGAVSEKLQNLSLQYGHPVTYLQDAGKLLANLTSSSPAAHATRAAVLSEITLEDFYYLLPSAGILGIAGILAAAMLLVRRRRESPMGVVAARILLCLVIGVVAWCIVLFGPPYAAADIHQGTYLMPVLLFAGAVTMLWVCSRRLALALVVLNCVWAMTVYAWLDVPPAVSAVTSSAFLAMGAVCAFLVVSLLVGWAARPSVAMLAVE